MALIDYKGYRLIALSLLPVSPATIRYGIFLLHTSIMHSPNLIPSFSFSFVVVGSCNSGLLVHRDIPELSAMMDRASTLLNLKPHVAGNTHATAQVLFIYYNIYYFVFRVAVGSIICHFSSQKKYS